MNLRQSLLVDVTRITHGEVDSYLISHLITSAEIFSSHESYNSSLHFLTICNYFYIAMD